MPIAFGQSNYFESIHLPTSADGSKGIKWPSGDILYLDPGGNIMKTGAPLVFRAVTCFPTSLTDASYSIFNLAAGDSFNRWTLNAVGKQQWGDGTHAPDTDLFRSAASTLKTTSTFIAEGLFGWVAGNEQATVGAAGAASAPPASPEKYLKIKDSSGATLVIPAYLAA
jgi:hypothetical protein